MEEGAGIELTHPALMAGCQQAGYDGTRYVASRMLAVNFMNPICAVFP